MKVLSIILIIIGAVILVLAVGRLIAQQVILHKSRSINKVNEIVTFKLGGHAQKILLEGKNSSLPILITLHGGPEFPFFNGFGYRGYYKELTKHYILAHWDQYGCGVNFVKKLDDIEIKNFTEMVCDMVVCLKKKYPGNPIYLYGFSWGTVLSLEASNLLGKEIAGIINWGQVTNMHDAKKNEYAALINTKLSVKKRNKLEYLMQKDTMADYLSVERMSFATNCMTYKKVGACVSKSYGCAGRLFISPDYSIKDIWHTIYWMAHQKKIYHLFCDLYEADEKDAMEKVEIPLLILQGETDPFSNHEFLEVLPDKNPNVTYISIPKCGHIPSNTGFETILQEIAVFSEKR